MFIDEFGVQYSDDKKRLILCPKDFQGAYVIPAYVEYIEAGAFAGILGITSVTFTNSDIYIDEDAFSGCDNLMNIIVPFGKKELFIQKFHDAYIEQSVTDKITEA